MSNAIAFSLYGSDRRYLNGMIRNAELARIVYPEWTVFVYADGTLMDDVRLKLSALGCVLRIGNQHFPAGLFWRFLINDDPQVERYIIRDADSRLNLRERHAVDAWIESGKRFHLIRDHPFHRSIVMGGLWGAVRGAIHNMGELIQKHAARDNKYGSDQDFIAQIIWPMVKNDCLQHDSCLRDRYPGSVPLPDGLKMGDWRFAGEIFDEHDQPHPEHFQMRCNWMEAE